LRSQFATSSWGGARYSPMAFSEHGILMLSSVLKSERAVQVRIRECLVASHIIPWNISEEHRTDPRNGLCLSATFDRLFDRGMITLTNDLCVAVSANLRISEDRSINEMICVFHGLPILRPRRFLPLPAYLEWHRNNVFQD
jgi:putative restriction endonuclease